MTSELANIQNTAKRCKKEGISFSESALRALVKNGDIPACHLGKKVLLYWPNVLHFIERGNNSRSGE